MGQRTFRGNGAEAEIPTGDPSSKAAIRRKMGTFGQKLGYKELRKRSTLSRGAFGDHRMISVTLDAPRSHSCWGKDGTVPACSPWVLNGRLDLAL